MKAWAKNAMVELRATEAIVRALAEFKQNDARVLLECAWRIDEMRRLPKARAPRRKEGNQ